jgi:Rod binding domain-containing protein
MPIESAVVSSLTRAIHVLGEKPKDDPARIRKSATDFEAMLLNQMLRSAREAGDGGLTAGGDSDHQANSSLIELGEQQFAQALAGSGGFGIAKMVVAGLTKHAHR